ncbi:HAAS signaling domain-containing protein [Heyndrickxia camelliae]|uniref:Uncharacterized protein n=1 Tax=Heyndrickxia camelliae TaxID=1707093 RepID=A0A2N3LFP6_9BACI|nr:hypothetical protein [Heyndrickxia camelliae]PKR83364.1 hypothetical protein CWO92_19490 [Heyndrickxia camelliae]
MKNLKQDYLHKLRLALHNHPEIEDILNEISTHMEDGIKDKMLVGKSEKAATEEVLFELGNPLVLGKNFMQPARSRTMIYLILLNWAFFVCGICLTLSHQLSDWAIVKDTWNYLSHKSNFILLLYSMYWVYVGYTIGKQYGPNGKKMVNKTMMWASIPNMLLMIITLFNVIPGEMFSPFLNPVFIAVCVLVTVLFFPLSKLAFKIGITYGL